MDTLWHIYGGEAALRQMQAPHGSRRSERPVEDAAEGQVFLELG